MRRGNIAFAVLLVAGAAGSLTADPCTSIPVCSTPPELEVLVGTDLTLDGTATRGAPSDLEWYIQAPDDGPPAAATGYGDVLQYTVDRSGRWSVGLRAHYVHISPLGGLHCDQTCVTVDVSAVVAGLSAPGSPVHLGEDVVLDGSSSRWGTGIEPDATWTVDGLPYGPCDQSPASPAELVCEIPSDSLGAGTFAVGLELYDPAGGETAVATATVEIIDPPPQTLAIMVSPLNPDPGSSAQLEAVLDPPIAEEDLASVSWVFGDGTSEVATCPSIVLTCTTTGHAWSGEGWFSVSLEVETLAGEILTAETEVEVGDPPPPPVASLDPADADLGVRQLQTFVMDGSCDGECSVEWSFGDGSTATGLAPDHLWVGPGTYPVTVTVSGPGGVDSAQGEVRVSNCWTPAGGISQLGSCHGAPVSLIAPDGTQWIWSTVATTQQIQVGAETSVWVDVASSEECWSWLTHTVARVSCGSSDGDANLDGSVAADDLAAILTELTDGDGADVAGTSGGDLLAPGADATADGLVDGADLQLVLERVFGLAAVSR